MSECSITSQQYSSIWIGAHTSAQLLVSFLDRVLVNNDRRIICALSSDTSIEIETSRTSVD